MELISTPNQGGSHDILCDRSALYEAQEERLFRLLYRVYGDSCAVETVLTDAVIRWWKDVDSLDEVDATERLFRYAVEGAEAATSNDLSLDSNTRNTSHQPTFRLLEVPVSPEAGRDARFVDALRFLPINDRLVLVLVDTLGFSREQVSHIVEREVEFVTETLRCARRSIRRAIHRLSADLRSVPLRVAAAAAEVQAAGEELARAVQAHSRHESSDPSTKL